MGFIPYPFIGGSFRLDFLGESFRSGLSIMGKQVRYKVGDKSYVFVSVNIFKELVSIWKIPSFNNFVNCHTSYCKHCSLYILKLGT